MVTTAWLTYKTKKYEIDSTKIENDKVTEIKNKPKSKIWLFIFVFALIVSWGYFYVSQNNLLKTEKKKVEDYSL